MKMLRIKVTQEAISMGTPNTASCPIARSILNQPDKAIDFVFVNKRVINVMYYIKGRYVTVRYKPSKRMIRFIDRFDRGLKVKPTTFYLWDFIHKYREHKTTLPHF